MIDVTALTDGDKGKKVRYTSVSKHTIMVGILQDWTAVSLVVMPTAYEAPKAVRINTNIPVQMDPANVEFI